MGDVSPFLQPLERKRQRRPDPEPGFVFGGVGVGAVLAAEDRISSVGVDGCCQPVVLKPGGEIGSTDIEIEFVIGDGRGAAGEINPLSS